MAETTKRNWAHLVTWIFYGLLAVVLAVGLWKKSGFMLWEGALTAGTVTACYLLYLWPKTKLPAGLYGAALGFVFLAMVVGKLWNMYAIFPLWDKVLHLLSGVILAWAGCLLGQKASHGYIAQTALLLFGLFFGMAMAGAWEIFEFTTDSLLGLHAQNGSLHDTMWDIICGTVGAVAYTGLYYIKKCSTEN